MTIGDVLAAITAILGLGATWAATVLLVALICPVRTWRAQEILIHSSGRCCLRGVAVAILVGLPAFLLFQTSGPGKLLAGLLLALLAALVALGSAGIVQLLGERIQAAGTPLSPFETLTRATTLYVAAGFFPIVGWFLVIPVAGLLALGSGVAVLRRVQTRTAIGINALEEGTEAAA